MEQQFEAIEMQIWEYLDGAGTAEARKRVEQLIATNELWQKKHAELSAFQRAKCYGNRTTIYAFHAECDGCRG